MKFEGPRDLVVGDPRDLIVEGPGKQKRRRQDTEGGGEGSRDREESPSREETPRSAQLRLTGGAAASGKYRHWSEVGEEEKGHWPGGPWKEGD